MWKHHHHVNTGRYVHKCVTVCVGMCCRVCNHQGTVWGEAALIFNTSWILYRCVWFVFTRTRAVGVNVQPYMWCWQTVFWPSLDEQSRCFRVFVKEEEKQRDQSVWTVSNTGSSKRTSNSLILTHIQLLFVPKNSNQKGF